MRLDSSYQLHRRARKSPKYVVAVGLLVVAIAAIAILAGVHFYPKHASPSNFVGSLIKGVTGQTSAVPPDGKAMGIAAGSSLPTLSPESLNTRMAAIQATGASWVRFDFDWSQIQPNNSPTYNWALYDKVVAAAENHNLHVLGIIDYTPSWARATGCQSKMCPPVDPSTYAQFATQLSRHYASKNMHYWEIWNEPNNPAFWQPGDNPQAYVDLLRATYKALHAADAHAYVITAGLSPQPDNQTAMSPINFMKAIYSDGAAGYFDAVADHPYTFPLTPASDANDAWTQMADPNDSIRATMVAHGDADKKIWITEFGAPTGGPGPIATLTNPNLDAQPYVVDQALQAKILSDAIAKYQSYDWAGPLFYYTYQDAGTDQSSNENFFGLVSASGEQKQAYKIFQSAATSIKE